MTTAVDSHSPPDSVADHPAPGAPADSGARAARAGGDSDRYHLLIVGGGEAGLAAAAQAARRGARVAIVEQHALGGQYQRSARLPRQTIVQAARAVGHLQRATELGVYAPPEVEVDDATIRARIEAVLARFAQRHTPQGWREQGVDVFAGEARFTSRNTLKVEGRTLTFRRALVATGSRPRCPEVPGLAEVGYLTEDTLASLARLPRRLIVVGAGAIGCELAQAFKRLGSDVQLVETHDGVLAEEDPAAARLVQSQLERDRVRLHLGCRLLRAETTGNAKSLIIQRGGHPLKLLADAILVAVGRQPYVEGLALDVAGVRCSARGVEVNNRLQTSNPTIYAAGDVAAIDRALRPVAAEMGCIGADNALRLAWRRIDRLAAPRVIATDPELAQLGLTAREARQHGIEIDSFRADFDQLDGADVNGATGGFAVVHTRHRTGHVIGATIVGPQARELASELALLVTRRLPMAALAHPTANVPSYSQAWQQVAQRYRDRRPPSPLRAWLVRTWLAWQQLG